MEKNYKGPNRRKTSRLTRPVPVKYMLPLDFSTETWTASAYDIGGGGLRIRRKDFVKEGTIAALEITLPTEVGEVDKVKIIAQVVWCHKVREKGDYSVGLKFVFPDNSGFQKIDRYVDAEMKRLRKEVKPR